jgi:hypothetical protein
LEREIHPILYLVILFREEDSYFNRGPCPRPVL